MSGSTSILHLVSYSLFSGPLAPTLSLAIAQRSLGHRVSVLCDRKRGNVNGFEEAAAPRLDAAGFSDRTPELVLSAKSSPMEMMRDIARLRDFLRGPDADVIHMHMSHDHTLHAVAAQGLEGSPVSVRTFHAQRSLENRVGQKFLNRRADGWICRTEEDRTIAIERFELDPDRVRVIKGSIDHEAFVPADAERRAAARRDFDIPADALVLGHVALIAGRGQEELVDALAAVEDLFVLFVGAGENESALRDRAEQRGVASRVRFSGYLKGAELYTGYAALDGAYLAQAGNDASVRAALEAMSCALPVIAVQSGALEEAVDDTVGYPIATKTVEDVTQGLRMFRDDTKRGERGERGRGRVVGEHNVAKEASETLSFYETLRLSR